MENGIKLCTGHTYVVFSRKQQQGSINYIVIRNTVMAGEARLCTVYSHSIKCSAIRQIGKCIVNGWALGLVNLVKGSLIACEIISGGESVNVSNRSELNTLFPED